MFPFRRRLPVISVIMEEQCIICSSILKDENELSKHYHEQHPNIIFTCYVCTKSFVKLEQLYLHLNQDHTIEKPDQSKIALYNSGQIAKDITKSVSVGFLDGSLPSLSEPGIKVSAKRKDRKRSGRNLLGGSQKCVVEGCLSSCQSPGVKLFRFPKRNLHQRYLWVALMNKEPKDGEAWMAKPWHRICSLHFKDGKHSADQKDENYIPTLFTDSLEEGPSFEQQASPAPEVILCFFLNTHLVRLVVLY